MKQFKLLQGKHFDENGKKYVVGDLITTHVDLVAQDKQRFELVGTAAPVKEETPATNNDSGDNDGDSDNDNNDENDFSELGEDITAEHPGAVDADLKVFKSGGWCKIVDPDKPEGEQVLNDKGVREDDVAEFIDTYLHEEE